MTIKKLSNLAIRVLGIYLLATGSASAIAMISPLFKTIYYNDIHALAIITYILFILPVIMGILFIVRPQLITRHITYTNTDFDLEALYQLTLKITGLLLVLNSGKMLFTGFNLLQEGLFTKIMLDYLFYGGLDFIIQVSLIVVGIIIFIRSKAISDRCARGK